MRARLPAQGRTASGEGLSRVKVRVRVRVQGRVRFLSQGGQLWLREGGASRLPAE